MKTPYERWQERTKNGRKMAAGWVHKRFDPPREGEYEVQGHAHRSVLTWAYGSWWMQSVGDDQYGPSGSWHHVKGRFHWRGPRNNACHVNWGHLVQQAAEMGDPKAQAEIERAQRDYDARICRCYRSGCEGFPCPVHSH